MKKMLKKYVIFSICLGLIWSCNSNKPESIKSFASDKEAANITAELYSELRANLENGIMLGHNDDLAYGNKWYKEAGRSDVKSVCGDYPAVFGWNIGNIEVGGTLNDDSIPFSDIRTYINKVETLGGISVLNWEVRNPVTGNSCNDCSINNVVNLILNSNNIQKRYFVYLDKLAVFLNSLKDENGNLIPVIFQPFQGNNISGKYWWGSQQCTADDFKKLWILTIDYLQNKKAIHHILYSYSFFADASNDALANCYPGNNYVDIVGISLLFTQENDPTGAIYKRTLNSNLASITQFADKNKKIAALTSTGMEGIKIPNYFTSYVYPIISQYKLSYVMFGRNSWNDENKYFIPIPGHPASDDFNVFSKSPKILTCSKISG